MTIAQTTLVREVKSNLHDLLHEWRKFQQEVQGGTDEGTGVVPHPSSDSGTGTVKMDRQVAGRVYRPYSHKLLAINNYVHCPSNLHLPVRFIYFTRRFLRKSLCKYGLFWILCMVYDWTTHTHTCTHTHIYKHTHTQAATSPENRPRTAPDRGHDAEGVHSSSPLS